MTGTRNSAANSRRPFDIDERAIAFGSGIFQCGSVPTFFSQENRVMLFLGIDQHARQLTVSLRDQGGDVLLARQVSTQPEKVLEFFDQLTRSCAQRDEQFIAVVEVCGFNDWLIRMLRDYRCHKVILIQPEERKRCKTDRRDAAALSELLWVNRDRFLEGKPVRGLRQVNICSTTQQENPQAQHAAQRSGSGTNPAGQQDQAHPPATQPAMGAADEDLSHREGDCLAPRDFITPDRSTGDELPVSRSQADSGETAGTGEADRTART
ncbi:IS110 family transposase [Planctomicrobium sp. SH661]|uniref:IS110 family transposase n=1 Tax=Planctomicrobium sp. SH661 TaxID=3448124 RepID=UPI003F5BE647